MAELTQYRYLRAEPEDFDESDGKRTLAVCFSSETPVLRREQGGREYWEVLSHSKTDADFSMLQNGGAFLDQHDDCRQLGSIKSAWLDTTDRKGRAILSFGNTKLADER